MKTQIALTLCMALLAGNAWARQPDPQDWKKSLENVAKHGAYRPTDGFIPASMGLAKIQGPQDEEHQAEYLNLWGAGEPADFEPAYATLVSESWKIDKDGNWNIEQWTFRARMDGSVAESTHQLIVEDFEGWVIDIKPLPASEEEAAAKINGLVKDWSAYSGGKPAKQRPAVS